MHNEAMLRRSVEFGQCATCGLVIATTFSLRASGADALRRVMGGETAMRGFGLELTYSTC